MSLRISEKTPSVVSFTAKNDVDNMDPRVVASSFVNLSDSQVKSLAISSVMTPAQEKKNRKSFIASLYAIPVAAVIADGILEAKSGLKTSLKTMGKSSVKWAGALGLLGMYNVVKSGLALHSEGFRNFEKGNPGASLVLDLGIFTGLLALGARVYDKLKVKTLASVLEKHSDKLDKAVEFKNKIAGKIDSSYLNKNLLSGAVNQVEKLSKKAPWLTKSAKFGLRNIVWFTLAASMLHTAAQARRTRDKIEHNYIALKDAQVKTAQKLVNSIESPVEKTENIEDID